MHVTCKVNALIFVPTIWKQGKKDTFNIEVIIINHYFIGTTNLHQAKSPTFFWKSQIAEMYCFHPLFLLPSSTQFAVNVIISGDHFNGLVQERRNSSALALELHLSCTNPSILLRIYTRNFKPMEVLFLHLTKCDKVTAKSFCKCNKCTDMCKILWWSDGQKMEYKQFLCPLDLNCKWKFVSDIDP